MPKVWVVQVRLPEYSFFEIKEGVRVFEDEALARKFVEDTEDLYLNISKPRREFGTLEIIISSHEVETC
jgi:hypothetical protein